MATVANAQRRSPTNCDSFLAPIGQGAPSSALRYRSLAIGCWLSVSRTIGK